MKTYEVTFLAEVMVTLKVRASDTAEAEDIGYERARKRYESMRRCGGQDGDIVLYIGPDEVPGAVA